MRLDSSQLLRVPSGLRVSRLGIAAILLMLGHIVTLNLFGHSQAVVAFSDIFLLISALFAMVVCFLTSRRSQGIARPFWFLAGIMFGSWSLGKCFVLYDSYYLGLTTIHIVPLILFFLAAMPMYVAVFLSDDDFASKINWEWILDAFQILSLGIILYLFVVYVPLQRYGEQVVDPIEDQLLLWRNVLLTGALLGRAMFSRSRYVSRLFLPVAIIMGIFACATWFANRAQDVSKVPETAWYDLAWTIPFCLFALAATLWQDSREEKSVPLHVPGFSRVIFAYLPSLSLPILLLVKNRSVIREQIFLGLFGLMLSIILFNVRLVLTLRRQRLTEEALHAAEQQYRSLFERTLVGVFRTTMDGRFLDCNPAFAKMVGYAREELRGIPMSQLYFGGEEERNHWILELRHKEQPQSRETRLRRKDGSILWVLRNANIEKQADGSEVLEGMLGDLTELRRKDAALRESESMFRALAENTSAGIYIHDSQRFLYVNPYLAESLGYTVKEMLELDSIAATIHPEDQTELANRIQRWLTGEAVDPRFAFRTVGKTGDVHYVQSAARMIQMSGRAVIVGVVVDVTERVRAEEQLRQSQKMEAMGRLAGGIAHDFNNLLTIISGYSTMQFERTTPSDPAHHEAEQIRSAAERAAALTRQLLAFSRKQVLQPRRINLNDIVRNLDKMLRRLIGEDIEVLTALSPNLGTVKVDPGQMDQVLINLVVNARDAMPKGGKLTIQTENVELDEEYGRKHEYVSLGRHVLLSVSDSGTGMDPETLGRIFEPFFTTKEPGKGTGLGLPTVYGIVKQSGGSIEVYSEPDHGTTVKVYLPRVDLEVEEITSGVAKFGRERGSERILLAEDDELIRDLVVNILTAHGYTIHVVEKLEELEGVMQRGGQCSLLLTDVVMPKMNGPELAKRVTAHWPRIKVLYMSGYAADAIVHHGVLDPGLFFLQKPFSPAVLVAKVREVLDAPSGQRAQ